MKILVRFTYQSFDPWKFVKRGELSRIRVPLLDVRQPLYRQVTETIARATKFVGYATEGTNIRLKGANLRALDRELADAFVAYMTHFKKRLSQATAALDSHYAEMIEDARQRHGDLFDIDDYPPSLASRFGLSYCLLDPAATGEDMIVGVDKETTPQFTTELRDEFDRLIAAVVLPE